MNIGIIQQYLIERRQKQKRGKERPRKFAKIIKTKQNGKIIKIWNVTAE